jgi:hypothetical protein
MAGRVALFDGISRIGAKMEAAAQELSQSDGSSVI